MRHGKKFNHLSRTTSHRKAMLANMASSLIKHKRVSTTVAKAKALRVYVEPIINRSKDDTTHSRRVVFSHLQDKDTVKELFAVVAGKVAERPGGYTRIIKVGNRAGDNADMCIIELVDFNEHLLKDTTKSSGKSRRSRRGGKKGADTSEETAKTEKVEAKKEAPKAKAEKVEEKVEPKAEATPEAKTEEAPKEAKESTEKKEEPKAEEKAEVKSEEKADSKSESNDDSKTEDKADDSEESTDKK